MKFEYKAGVVVTVAALSIGLSFLIYSKVSCGEDAKKPLEIFKEKEIKEENPQLVKEKPTEQEKIQKKKNGNKLEPEKNNEIIIGNVDREVKKSENEQVATINQITQKESQLLSPKNVNAPNQAQQANISGPINIIFNIGKNAASTGNTDKELVENSPELAELLDQKLKPDRQFTKEEYSAYLEQEKYALGAFNFLKRENLSKSDREKCKETITRRTPEFVHFMLKNRLSLDDIQFFSLLKLLIYMNNLARELSDMEILQGFLSSLSDDIHSVVLFWWQSPNRDDNCSISENGYKNLAQFAETDAGKVPQIKEVLKKHYELIKKNYIRKNPKADVNSIMPNDPFK